VRLLGLITARGGSKRVPGKNLRNVGGKPLVAWTIEEACKSTMLDAVVMTTDDAKIAEVARRYGASVPFMRPYHLAEDATPHIDCVFHAIEQLLAQGEKPFDAVVLLQPTSPLRTADDIDGLLRYAIENNAESAVTIHESVEHPYFIRFLNEENILCPIIKQDIFYPRKQDLEKTYYINGAIYFNTLESLYKTKSFYPKKQYGYEISIEHALQVDSEFDLTIADLLLRRRERI
jgi:CMP-N-acetylneuraminic acid synthetase